VRPVTAFDRSFIEGYDGGLMVCESVRSTIGRSAHPCRDIALAMKDAPDINVIAAFDLEN
jgi:hypothetical protein